MGIFVKELYFYKLFYDSKIKVDLLGNNGIITIICALNYTKRNLDFMTRKLEGYTQAQADMLRYVFDNGKVSRAQLAQELKLSNLTVINGVKKLLEDGVLAECGTLPSDRGRKVTLLSVNPELHYFMVVDIGSFSTKLAVVRFDGSILHREEITNSYRNVNAVYMTVDVLKEHLTRILNQYGKARFRALCFCISGTVDFANKTCTFCANIQGWNDINFRDAFEDYFQLPVYLDSSGHCAAMAERQFGNGKNCSDLVFISAGCAISTGIILGGKLLRGISGAAGELGHVQVRNESKGHNWMCTCGQRNCLEMQVTAPGIRKKLSNARVAEDPSLPADFAVSDKALYEAYHAGDPATVKAVEDAARILGQQTANIADMLNPQKIIFGGGTIHHMPQMIDIIRQEIKATALPVISRELTVEQTALGPNGPLMGAALLAIYDILKKSTEK